jgi:hypothetical protein
MNRKLLLVAGSLCVVAGATLAVLALRRQAPHPATAPANYQASGEAIVGQNSAWSDQSPRAAVPSHVASIAPARENVVPESGGRAEAVVRIKPRQVLATVNGASITLKDLLPLSKEKAGSEQMLSAEMYDFLFQRAIDREVTFQAARAQGADLTDAQKQRLAEIRAQSERSDPAAFDTLHQNSNNTDFEQRDLAGVALQSVLAEKAGVPAPYVTSEQVEAYLKEHKSEYPQVSADPAQRSAESWLAADTDIRSKLTPRLQAEHDRQMAEFMAQLKAKAGVVVVAQQQ